MLLERPEQLELAEPRELPVPLVLMAPWEQRVLLVLPEPLELLEPLDHQVPLASLVPLVLLVPLAQWVLSV